MEILVRDMLISLHKKWSFSLKVSSVNVNKSARNFYTFTEEILNEKLHFLVKFVLFHRPEAMSRNTEKNEVFWSISLANMGKFTVFARFFYIYSRTSSWKTLFFCGV